MSTKKVATKKVVEKSCNVLVVGGTGVGKSSLINYLVGKTVAKVGVGVPVTSRDDIPAYPCTIGDVRLRLFDTWGIEADKTEDWKRRIRGIIGTDGDDGVAWFHTIVYCISAGGERFQDYDRQMIRYFVSEGYSLVVALTKSDQVSEETAKKLSAAIPRNVPRVEVSSGGHIRSGMSKPFGKEDLLAQIVNLAVEKLPERTKHFALSQIDNWESVMLDELEYKDISRFGNSDIEEWIKENAGDFAHELNEKIESFQVDEYAILNKLSKSAMLKNSSIDINVSQLKQEAELSALEIPFAILFSPFAIVAGLICGADWEKENLEKMIRDACRQMRKAVQKNFK